MTQLLMPAAPKRPGSRPLDPVVALRAALESSVETTRAITASPENFEAALSMTEMVLARFRAACLCFSSREAEAAVAYHDRAIAELNEEFAPLYYRRAVLENVVARYERSAAALLQAQTIA